jgi:hypothetical protein
MLQAMLTTVAALFLAFAATVAEADDVGRIVSMEGTVEIGRAGAFARVENGASVQAGDTVRTGNPGRARILFPDESVLNVGDDSTILIDESVFDPNKGAASTMMHLLGGKVRALVSEYYSGSRASYQIETTTAVSGVRGTEFVMAYDPKTKLSTVLGLGGSVAVHSPMDRKKRGVLVHANEITEIAKGRFPTPPRQIRSDDEEYRSLMDGLDLPGGGLPETLLMEDPAFGGKQIPNPDSSDGNVGVNPADGNGDQQPTTELPPQDASPTGGDALDQPQPVLDAATDIDIRF